MDTNNLLLIRGLDGIAAAIIAIGCGFDGDIYAVYRSNAITDDLLSGYRDVVAVNVTVPDRQRGMYHVKTYETVIDYYDEEWRSHSAYNDFAHLVDMTTRQGAIDSRREEAKALMTSYLKCQIDCVIECVYTHNTIVKSSHRRFIVEWDNKVRAKIKNARTERMKDLK